MIRLKNEYQSFEIQPQVRQDDEKMKLATQLADANTKLINAEFGKFERELQKSNNRWIWGWSAFSVGIIAVIGVALVDCCQVNDSR